MPTPKNFAPQHAVGEQYDIARNGSVYVYRFGNRDTARDWLSRRRQAAGGNYADLPPSELNDWALKQSSYGSASENAEDNPFISVATDYESLYEHGEGWVQKILQTVPTLGVFLVPPATLYRPSPTKLISRQETEWLFYDAQAPLTDYLVEWRANPKRV